MKHYTDGQRRYYDRGMTYIAPFSYFGGKLSHLKFILPYIDGTPHRTYVEPFGGSAAVLINKLPSQTEVYNDLHSDLVHFFRMLREHPGKMVEVLQLTPYSREEFARACTTDTKTLEDLERARTFFVRARQVRAGLGTKATPGYWAYGIRRGRRGISETVSRWLTSVDMLPEIAQRLLQVQIENLDALDCIARYDYEEALFYCDPPYLPDTRTAEKAYHHEYGQGAHVALLELLARCKGRVVLSGYASELYHDILNGWILHKDKEKCAPATCNKAKTKGSIRQECVWTNFVPLDASAS